MSSRFYQGQGVFRKNRKIGYRSGNAEIESLTVFRLSVDLFCSGMDGLKICNTQDSRELVYDSEAL